MNEKITLEKIMHIIEKIEDWVWVIASCDIDEELEEKNKAEEILNYYKKDLEEKLKYLINLQEK